MSNIVLLFLYFDISSATLTVNTNQTTPIKLKSIESATNGCASRNKIGALGEVRFKTVALRGIPRRLARDECPSMEARCAGPGVTPCGNRARCTLRGSRLPSHRVNRANCEFISIIDAKQLLLDKIYSEFYPDHNNSSETFNCQITASSWL
ncbi:hypothetical protein SFRURICE_021232 [Spodoptera frugiperda]|nr:hypothetical protein SFRURICE_021232 [Spodoptera frugiperda]